MAWIDVAADVGIDHVQAAGVRDPDCVVGLSHAMCEAAWISGGVAVADFNGDRWPDLYFTVLDGPDRLYLNREGKNFEPMATDKLGPATASNGVGVADVDRDGLLDIVITTHGADTTRLLMGQPDGSFVDEAATRGLIFATRAPRVGQSVAFTDLDRDGYTDVFLTTWHGDNDVWAQEPTGVRLLKNRGESEPGVFDDVTDAWGLGDVWTGSVLGGTWLFGALFTDLDQDGADDLIVSADFGTSRMFWRDPNGERFIEGTQAAGMGTDENGMGLTLGDIDGDGDLDAFITSIADPDNTCALAGCNWGTSGNRLYRNEGGRRFADATDAYGVRGGGWGWGAAMFDPDADGDLDVLMTNGIVFPGNEASEPYHHDPMRLWQTDGELPLTEVSRDVGIEADGPGKGLALVDFDRDGDTDVVVVHTEGAPLLYRNDTPRAWANTVRVRLVGTRSTPEAWGAQVELLDEDGHVERVATPAPTGFLGQSERVVSFGVAHRCSESVDVRVRWPSGATSTHTIERGAEAWLREPPA